ncbi:hypothetical protein A2397_02855 [Candidatus Amesbacteria bacterium RIFOXYB1_FULL_44_23]|uniref:Fibronectin type-III domain-containing protein n=1 Tax=Candidatus Amesbacteria bacterium RIFOXYB1_FULL_44_23 TaxID=1797263 RepID=A0A1F4ZS35_9BACT|nr:MAG: hypothetical protein A2397_02855 [Candidatus Amesbacteria bacterium RIFOXYB1_FULL_44_23]
MNIREIRIPTILGLFLALGGLVSGLWLVQNQSQKNALASAENTPNKVAVSNISDSSFVVSWVTDKATVGFVQYGEGQSLDMVVTDDRDQERGSVQSSLTHLVTVRGLKPATTYKFKVGAGKQLYDQNGAPYEVVTGSTIAEQPPEADVAYGQVVTQSSEPAEGAIVYLQIPGGVMAAAMVKNTGSWVIPLSTIRTADLGQYLRYDKTNTEVVLQVQGGALGSSQATITTGTDSPVYEIMLGKNYEKTTAQTETGAEEVASESATLEVQKLPVIDLKLLTPLQGEGVNTQKPQIIGEAPAGTEVTVEVHSENVIVGKAVADSDGTFTYAIPENLEPGEHTLTLTAVVEGVTKKITRSFVVYAAGESGFPVYTATPSATIAMSPTPSVRPSPSPTLRPTAVPTAVVTIVPTVKPTTIPTPTASQALPTNIPTPTIVTTITPTAAPKPTAVPTPVVSLPESGGESSTRLLLLVGLGITLLGVWGLKKSQS